jgi:hypothetical protein
LNLENKVYLRGNIGTLPNPALNFVDILTNYDVSVGAVDQSNFLYKMNLDGTSFSPELLTNANVRSDAAILYSKMEHFVGKNKLLITDPTVGMPITSAITYDTATKTLKYDDQPAPNTDILFSSFTTNSLITKKYVDTFIQGVEWLAPIVVPDVFDIVQTLPTVGLVHGLTLIYEKMLPVAEAPRVVCYINDAWQDLYPV